MTWCNSSLPCIIGSNIFLQVTSRAVCTFFQVGTSDVSHADQHSCNLADNTDDIQKRYSVFYLIGCVASALAGVLAFGLMQMGGIQGISGWRWIFIMEGVVCF